MQYTTEKTTKPKKSVRLTREERKELREKLNYYDTMTEAAIDLKIGREVLIRTRDLGRCSEVTYKILFPETVSN